MARNAPVLTEVELAKLDAAYNPFPAFVDWPQELPRPPVWDARKLVLDQLSAAASPDDLDAALELTMRAAAFETGAIEGLYATDRGLTRTVATQAFMWEQKADEAGARALFEAQLSAYELVLDVATASRPVTEVWIRQLHEELTAPQETYIVSTPAGRQEQPLLRGEYKKYPNHVETVTGSTHSYAPVASTGAEMQRLIEELKSDEFSRAPADVQAAYAHYAFVAVHPFADGNGRVARALASVYLYRGAGVPLLILADQREQYFRALATADAGDVRPFLQFVFDAGIVAMSMVTETLKTAQVPPTEQTLADLRALMTAQGSLTHRELDSLGTRIADELVAMFKDVIGEFDLPQGVAIKVVAGSGANQGTPPTRFRSMIHGGARFVYLEFRSASPARASRNVAIDVFVSVQDDETETVHVQVAEAADAVTLSLNEIYPNTAMSAQHRLRELVERVLRSELRVVLAEARSSLEASGYSTADDG